MEVVEFEPNHAMAVVIREGHAEMNSRTTFEAVSDNQIKIATIIDISGMDASADKTFLNSRLERSAQIRKQLMESEI